MKSRLFMFIALVMPILANAIPMYKHVTVNGVIYEVHFSVIGYGETGANNAVIVGVENLPASGQLAIPETVNAELKRQIDEDGNTEPYTATFKVDGIFDGAFSGCNSLTSISIPSWIKNIGSGIFDGCDNLSEVKVDIENTIYDSRNNCNAIIETSTNKIIAACKSTTIPDDVEKIGSLSFSNLSGITNFTIPASIKEIEGNAIYKCSDLQSITVLGNFYNSSEESFFSDCPNVTKVKYDCNYITYLGDFPSVTEVELTNKVLSIGNIKGFSGITNIYIPTSVNWIGNNAFSNCENLTSIEIGEVKNMIVYRYTFSGCEKLTDILCHAKNTPFIEEKFDDAVSKISLHVNDYSIESYKANPFWSNFKEIVVFEKVTDFNLIYYINGEEYKNEQHKYDDEITPEEEPTKKGMMFSGWSEIPEKMPGKNVDVKGTFTWLKDMNGGVIYQVTDTINNNAAVIGTDNASGEVKIVSSVNFDYDYSITDIVDNVFKNNTDITSVVIPESVRKIGDEAFYGCKNLAKIELGKNVNQIEPRAFAGIDKLTDVTIYAEDVPSTDRTAFENSYIEDYVTLHVPAGSVEKYKAAAPWKNFKEIIAISDAVTDDTDVDVITIKSYGKGTYCSDYDLDFSYTENLKAFIVTGYDHKTNTIWLTRVKSVPAGTGIIVKGTPGDYKVKHVESLSVYANFLVGTTEDKKIKDVEGEMTNFVLSKGEWYRFDGEITLPKGMAYLPLPLSKFAGTRSLTEVYEDNDEGTTGIRTIEQGTVSSEHDVWFNLQGQRIDKPRKGLYIRNGKKVVIRSTTK